MKTRPERHRFVALDNVTIALCVALLAVGCARHYEAGDCFALRGSGSKGEVVEVRKGAYLIELDSSKHQTQWQVPSAQLEMDARRQDCVASR